MLTCPQSNGEVEQLCVGNVLFKCYLYTSFKKCSQTRTVANQAAAQFSFYVIFLTAKNKNMPLLFLSCF